ncbi:hypothetical protein [Streptomyces iconiensis]|uniref:DUF533 domain-containing protein n=1 Tax=Streptomyces iconiensis TaxID=1384038 RepID=A0ABT6ZQ98_9ACTN|nr:hypothetical protein [Streptomyces iconiensis]MDJ1131223.1 hypothetical protein [Streptomyces iconiensis]
MKRIEDSHFYGWLVDHARTMGWDLDATTDEAPRPRDMLRVWAAIALTEGLTDEQVQQLAHGLGVAPAEVRAAFEPEMRTAELGEILGQPDLAALDRRLDGIADDNA